MLMLTHAELLQPIHRALGCIGTITDGVIRDVDEMTNAFLGALARRFCVGHADLHPIRWDCGVEVLSRTVRPGDLIHAARSASGQIVEQTSQNLEAAVAQFSTNVQAKFQREGAW
jgi:regulator of RNase E activity RraA